MGRAKTPVNPRSSGYRAGVKSVETTEQVFRGTKTMFGVAWGAGSTVNNRFSRFLINRYGLSKSARRFTMGMMLAAPLALLASPLVAIAVSGALIVPHLIKRSKERRRDMNENELRALQIDNPAAYNQIMARQGRFPGEMPLGTVPIAGPQGVPLDTNGDKVKITNLEEYNKAAQAIIAGSPELQAASERSEAMKAQLEELMDAAKAQEEAVQAAVMEQIKNNYDLNIDGEKLSAEEIAAEEELHAKWEKMFGHLERDKRGGFSNEGGSLPVNDLNDPNAAQSIQDHYENGSLPAVMEKRAKTIVGFYSKEINDALANGDEELAAMYYQQMLEDISNQAYPVTNEDGKKMKIAVKDPKAYIESIAEKEMAKEPEPEETVEANYVDHTAEAEDEAKDAAREKAAAKAEKLRAELADLEAVAQGKTPVSKESKPAPKPAPAPKATKQLAKDQQVSIVNLDEKRAENILDNKPGVAIFKQGEVKVKPGDKVMLYAKSPRKEVIGSCEAEEVVTGTPTEIWNKVKDDCVISKNTFIKQCNEVKQKNSPKVSYIRPKNASRLDKPVPTADLGMRVTTISHLDESNDSHRDLLAKFGISTSGSPAVAPKPEAAKPAPAPAPKPAPVQSAPKSEAASPVTPKKVVEAEEEISLASIFE